MQQRKDSLLLLCSVVFLRGEDRVAHLAASATAEGAQLSGARRGLR